MSKDAVLNLLGGVEKDPEIISLEFGGAMDSVEDTQTIVLALVGLFSLKDRTWEGLVFHVSRQCVDLDESVASSQADEEDEEDQVLRKCTRILEQACARFRVPLNQTPPTEAS